MAVISWLGKQPLNRFAEPKFVDNTMSAGIRSKFFFAQAFVPFETLRGCWPGPAFLRWEPELVANCGGISVEINVQLMPAQRFIH